MTKRDLRTMYLRSYRVGLVTINPVAEIAIYSLVFGVILAVNRSLPRRSRRVRVVPALPHFRDGHLELLPGHVVEGAQQLHVDREAPPEALLPAGRPGHLADVHRPHAEQPRDRRPVLFYLLGPRLGEDARAVPHRDHGTLAGLGVGLLLSVANSRYRDVGYLYSIFLRLFFYLIPIIWSIEFAEERIGVDWLVPIVRWNPFAKMIELSRDGTYLHEWGRSPTGRGSAAGRSVFCCSAGSMFARSSADVAEGST